MRESRSNPNVGIVSMRCRGINQRARGRDRVQADVHGLQARRARGRRQRSPAPTRTGRCEMTAAQTIARWSTTASPSTTSRRTSRSTRSSTCSTRSAAGSPPTRSGVAGEGRADDGRARRRAAGDGDRPRRAGCPAANAAFANAMLCHGLDFDDTHSDSVSHVSTVIAPGRARRRRGGRARAARDVARRDRRPATRSCAGSAWRRRASSTAAASTRPRSAASSAASPRSPGSRGARRRRRTTSALGIAGSFAAGSSPISRTARRRSRCTPPGRRTARISRRGSPRTARPGPPSVLEGKFGLYHAFLARRGGRDRHRAASSPTSARAGRRRGSPTSRTRSATSCTARSGATAERGRTDVRARRDRRRRRHRARGRRLARARAGRREDGAALASTRASSRCSTRSRRCSCAGTSASPTSPDEAIADPRVLAVAREGALRDEGLPHLPAGVPRRRARPLARRPHVRGRLPVPEGRAREPAHGRRGAGEVPRERVARARRGRWSTRSRRPSSRSRSRTTSPAALAPLALRRAAAVA